MIDWLIIWLIDQLIRLICYNLTYKGNAKFCEK